MRHQELHGRMRNIVAALLIASKRNENAMAKSFAIYVYDYY